MHCRGYEFFTCCVVGAVMLVAATGSTQAAIISTTGAMTEVSPPLNLTLGSYEATLAVFLESQLPSGNGLMVDWPVPLPAATSAGPYQGMPMMIAVLMSTIPVNIYMIHWDSFQSTVGTAAGTVTFSPNEQVLGLITGDLTQDNSDATLGHPSVIYPFGLAWRGTTETVPGAGPDPITISPARNMVTVSFTTTLATDQARLVVAVIPEPATMVLLGIGGLGLLMRRRRK